MPTVPVSTQLCIACTSIGHKAGFFPIENNNKIRRSPLSYNRGKKWAKLKTLKRVLEQRVICLCNLYSSLLFAASRFKTVACCTGLGLIMLLVRSLDGLGLIMAYLHH